ncbi:hypothetical protein KM043_002729 [Ampulex compressa]|nr:hypothetical protein KM043_002729 [Ampulex compressa]
MFPVLPRLHVTPILFSSLHSYLSQFNLSRALAAPASITKPEERRPQGSSSTRVNNTPPNTNIDRRPPRAASSSRRMRCSFAEHRTISAEIVSATSRDS